MTPERREELEKELASIVLSTGLVYDEKDLDDILAFMDNYQLFDYISCSHFNEEDFNIQWTAEVSRDDLGDIMMTFYAVSRVLDINLTTTVYVDHIDYYAYWTDPKQLFDDKIEVTFTHASLFIGAGNYVTRHVKRLVENRINNNVAEEVIEDIVEKAVEEAQE